MKTVSLASGLLAATVLAACGGVQPGSLRVECEGFRSLGGWTVETQSTRQIGSSYLMAHGYGVPVADAETEVEVPAAGRYVVWARTRNWNAVWPRPGADGRPVATGRFTVLVNGVPLAAELGGGDAAWHWARAGEVDLAAGSVRLALHDLTGFNGRCDALWLTVDQSARPPERPPAPAVKDDSKVYDLVVVGGGFAGSCTALAAARSGVDTLLLQDRGVLGGCNSSEVRVGLGGRIHAQPYPALGRVVEEIQPIFGYGIPLPASYYEDARKEAAFHARDLYWGGVPGVSPTLRFHQYVFAVEMDGAETNRIAAVLARDTRTGAVTRHRARLFCDATGDAVLSRLAGCEVMYGREARSRFNEISAPETGDRQVMGMSVQWLTQKHPSPRPFPDISAWALPIDDSTGYYQTRGSWEQETGFLRDMADDAERIRDYGLLAIFSNWNWVKNRSPRRSEYSCVAFSWISPIGGKRESYRTVGDYVLTQNDLENQVRHPDATAAITWDVDLHFPDPENLRKFAEPFRSAAYHRGFGADYPVPYRCLYARDCANLFLAGRDISCSHVAFAAVRVQRTLGMLGEVVGLAASICKEKGATPREVHSRHLDALKARMAAGVPPLPTFHGYSNGLGEKYDFNRRGWAHIYPPKGPISPDKAADIKAKGFVHRNEHPQLQDGRRRLVLADESREKLHVYDSADPKACFSIDAEKPIWNLTRIGDGLYRFVCKNGFMVADLKARRIVDTFRHDSLDIVTSVCDLPDGGFLASVNPRGSKKDHRILVRRFSKDRVLVSTAVFRGLWYGRTMTRLANGDLVLAYEKGFAICRLPEGDAPEADGAILRNVEMPKGRNLFEVIPDRAGKGYWAGAGYGAQLLRFDGDGRLVSAWTADQGGKKNVFYAQLQEQPNGHIYVANWTGHGPDDSFKGWQVIEFDKDGKVVWRLDSPDRYGSVSGIDVLETP